MDHLYYYYFFLLRKIKKVNIKKKIKIKKYLNNQIINYIIIIYKY